MPTPRPVPNTLELYSATIAVGASSGMVTIFHAMLAADTDEVRARITDRLGPALAKFVLVDRGFDRNDPFARMLLAPAMRELLDQVASEPTSPLSRGFEILVDQRLGG